MFDGVVSDAWVGCIGALGIGSAGGGLLECLLQAVLVIGVNLLHERITGRALRVLDKILPVEMPHLTPVGAYAIDGVCRCADEGAETALTLRE